MTEAEAKQRWCPFAASRSVSAQTEQGVVQVANMLGPPKDKLIVLCLASGCMAWRWEDKVIRELRSLDKSEDYCGLAGKP